MIEPLPHILLIFKDPEPVTASLTTTSSQIMSHRLDTLPHTAIIAHRGASRYAPQNTLAAFQLAIDQKADGIELDVRLTADGHLAVIHDATVRHTTNGRGWVAKLTLAELQKFDAGQGEKIPTLNEVFFLVGDKMLINVELKPILRHTNLLAQKVAETVHQFHLEKSVICSSFSPLALKALSNYAPEIPRGMLLPTGFFPAQLAALAGRTLTYQTLHPDFHDVREGVFSPELYPTHPIFTYTVNEEADMRAMFAMGVAGIFTDDPPLALRARGN